MSAEERCRLAGVTDREMQRRLEGLVQPMEPFRAPARPRPPSSNDGLSPGPATSAVRPIHGPSRRHGPYREREGGAAARSGGTAEARRDPAADSVAARLAGPRLRARRSASRRRCAAQARKPEAERAGPEADASETVAAQARKPETERKPEPDAARKQETGAGPQARGGGRRARRGQQAGARRGPQAAGTAPAQAGAGVATELAPAGRRAGPSLPLRKAGAALRDVAAPEGFGPCRAQAPRRRSALT